MKKLLFIFTLMLFPMLASAQTVSDVQNSGCTARARGAAGEGPVPTIMLTKEGNILSVEVLNYEANCCTDNFHVTSNINSGSDGSPSSLAISVVPVGALDCDCECPFNVSFTIRDLEPNSFYLKCWWYEGLVELTNGVPLVLEYKVEDVVIGEMSFRLLKVMHKAKLTKWTTEEKEIRIPSEVTYKGENYTVTSIDHDAFGDLDYVTKIAIPKTIRSTDLDVDDIIWANPFRECKSLEWIEVEEGCPLLSSDDGVLFAKNKTMLLGYPIASPRETYTVPEGVTNIRSGSFYHNKYLRKLIIPEGVTYLGWHLFSDTQSLETLYIKGVLDPECIVDGLFGDMSTNVNIYVLPSEVDKFKAIYQGPVYPLPEQTVTIDGLLYKLNLGTHTAMVANTNNWEGELDIPEQVAYDGETYTVDRLEWLAFDFCKTLTKVRIPKTVVNIQHYAGYEDCKNPFRSCTSLESIEVDEANPSMCSIDGILFSKDRTQLYCYPAGAKRKTYSVPDGVTWIGGDAFAYNYSLTSIYMPNSVTYMSFGTFSNCKSLHSIRLSENIKHISAYTFEKCESLHFLDFPESVMYFAESVFRWSPIKTIVIRGTFPDGLRGDTFYFMDDEVVIYVQPSEVDKFKAIYQGPVYPISEESQEYFPEGTKWTEIRLDTLKYDSWYSKVGDEWVPNFETIEYYVKGEYPDRDWVYKKVYTNGPEWTDSLTLLIRETEYNGHNSILASVLSHEYDGLYAFWPGEAYQFDWSIGKGLYYQDILMSNTTSMRKPYFYYGIIDEIKEGYFGGARPLKYVDLDGKAPDDETGLNRYVSTNGGRIIQGIGITEWNDGECLFGPPDPYFASTGEMGKRHYRSMLVHFERNGEVLYDVWPDVSLQINQGDFDYIPFVKDGKQWHVVRSEYGSGNHFDQFVLLNEKVVKDGKTYMKMYRSKDNATTVYDAGLLREENRKVYFFDDNTQKEYLMFDYSLKAGDTYETYSLDEQKMVSYKVISVGDYREGPDIVRHNYNQAADSMDIHQRYLQKWIVARTDNGLEKTWIEGVGSLEGPLANIYNERPVSSMNYLAYVDAGYGDLYLPFSFHDTMNKQVHGCNLPTGAENREDDDTNHHLIYELEGNRLHVYGEVFTQCGPNNYAYFIEKPTDDPTVHKIEFIIQDVAPSATCMALHATNFYATGFDPNLNYVVVDNRGEEHPVINKTPQMAYRPFVEEGKVWKEGDVSDNPVKLVEYYYFEGDTIINGKTCKQMMCQRYVSPNHPDYAAMSQIPSLSNIGAWYEEDKKVYEYDLTGKQFKLMYDFSANAHDTLQINDQLYIIGARQTGGLKGFKGVYRDVANHMAWKTTWLEGVGGLFGFGPSIDIYPGQSNPAWALMSCTVGDEVIYLNDEYQDGATPEKSNAPKQRLDFTHIIKTRPQAPMMRTAEQPLYGEYNDQQLGINLDPLAEAYLVRINNESGKTVYEKAINAGNIVGLSIDISAYQQGCYTVTIENSRESFTGQFYAQTSGIVEATSKKPEVKDGIYNLQGQRISTLQKGLNIVNGRKVLVK